MYANNNFQPYNLCLILFNNISSNNNNNNHHHRNNNNRLKLLLLLNHYHHPLILTATPLSIATYILFTPEIHPHLYPRHQYHLPHIKINTRRMKGFHQKEAMMIIWQCLLYHLWNNPCWIMLCLYHALLKMNQSHPILLLFKLFDFVCAYNLLVLEWILYHLAFQPFILQLTIPHDPRIDLIPTPHMRDRMILFREQFDLDDCFKCLLSASVFHGGDPAIAANWQLPKVFFEKYWFLTIDYTLRRTTNRWRRLQGLNELENDFAKGDDDVVINTATPTEKQNSENDKDLDEDVDLDNTKRQKQGDTSWAGDPTTLSSEDSAALAGLPALETQQSKQPPSTAVLPNTMESGFGIADLSSYLGVEFSKLEQMQQQQKQQHDGGGFNHQTHSIPPDMSTSPLQHPPDLHKHHDNDSFEPVRLTNGYLLPQKSKNSTAPSIVSNSSPPHPSSLPTGPTTATTLGNTPMPSESLQDKPSSLQHIQDPWEKMLLDSNHSGYDMLVSSFLHSDPHTS
ncbi:unnamed protein product [Absidia cylindrospora]